MTTKERDRDALEEPLEHEIDPEIQKLLHQHAGKWVAITRSELIAVGDSMNEVLKAAKESGVSSIILVQVPENLHSVYFF